MDKRTILVTAICGDIGCSAVRSLHATGHRIMGCDIESYSPVAQIVDKSYEVPPASDIDNYIESIKRIIDKEKVELFLPISEPEISVVNQRRSELEDKKIKLLLNNDFIISMFLDKLKTAEYLESIGIKTPRTMLLKNYDGSFDYPLIIKHKIGYGSKMLWKVDNLRDLEYVQNKDDGLLIIQEHVGSDSEEYTTGVFSDGEKVSTITFRRKLGFGGLSMDAILVDEPFLENLSMKVARSTGLIGSINIQSRRSGNSDLFIPFEVNPRLSSTLLLRKEFGFDDAVWWVDVLLGNGYSYAKQYKSGRAIRCLSECYFEMERL
ncbi:MAG: ATP-grasp domain-containing protein [Planctomycetes bacterium]|nr:ATP-grasp domain-containing protein [Planctomycetota bacterium]